MDIIDAIGRYVSVVAVLGLLLLVPLYLSQRRDLVRLREWHEREPRHPRADLAASEALLDRVEAELEALEGPAPSQVSQPAGSPTGERPALERITTEREALAPHPRWRHLWARLNQPRLMALVAIAATVLAAAGIVISEHLLESSGPNGGSSSASQFKVAVLNGTAAPGLGGKVASDLRAAGFGIGTVAPSRRQYPQTVVMYQQGKQGVANRVAHELGVKPVQPIDPQTRALAGAADVAVIVGADRAKP